jgi:glycosyltransferase involved in cell wall biosynthesis
MSDRRVLYIAPIPPPITGQAVACAALFEHLRNCGCEVDLIDLSKKSFHQGVDSGGRLLEIAQILFRVIRKGKRADLIYLTPAESVAGNLKDLLIYALCWRWLSRMIIHLHGGAGMRKLLSDEHPVLLRLNRLFLKRIGAVVVLGERLKSIYAGLVTSSRLHTIANFAGDEFFSDPEEVLAKFSLVAQLRLLFLSNLLPGKGHVEFLAALELLTPEERARFRVDIAGGYESPEDEEWLRRQVSRVGGADVKLHGVVWGEAKRELLRSVHLFCLPTYYPYEGQPISILEAYASGCAVLTTDHSGIFDTFAPGKNGYEVIPRSAESIAQALRHALEHPEQLLEWAQNNLRQAVREYRMSTHILMLEDVFASIQPQPR